MSVDVKANKPTETLLLPHTPAAQGEDKASSKEHVEYVGFFCPFGAWICLKDKQRFELRCIKCRQWVVNQDKTSERVQRTEDGLCYCGDCFTAEDVDLLQDEDVDDNE